MSLQSHPGNRHTKVSIEWGSWDKGFKENSILMCEGQQKV